MNKFKIKHTKYNQCLIKKGEIADARLAKNEYQFETLKKIDNKFSKMAHDYLNLCQWVEEHIDKFDTFEDGSKFMTIKIPFIDKVEKKCYPIDAIVTVHNVVDTVDGVKKTFNTITTSRDVMGHRLDWECDLFLDLLKAQDNIQEWCNEYMKSFPFKEKVENYSWLK